MHSPITDRFSAQDVSFIREWLLAIDRECYTFEPQTLIWTANMLSDDQNQDTHIPDEPDEDFDTEFEDMVNAILRMTIYAGVCLGMLIVSVPFLINGLPVSGAVWTILAVTFTGFLTASIYNYRKVYR